MIIEERCGQWPLMIITNELKFSLFKEWLDGTTYSGCVSIAEFNYMNSLILIIDCDVTLGRQEILKWWVEQEM